MNKLQNGDLESYENRMLIKKEKDYAYFVTEAEKASRYGIKNIKGGNIKNLGNGVFEIEGMRFINVTPHDVTLLSEKTGETYSLEKSGILINAKVIEEVVVEKENGIKLVKSKFVGDTESEKELNKIFDLYGDGGVVVIGSIIAAQAYPGRIFAMTPSPGFERVPPQDKRMNLYKYTTF